MYLCSSDDLYTISNYIGKCVNTTGFALPGWPVLVYSREAWNWWLIKKYLAWTGIRSNGYGFNFKDLPAINNTRIKTTSFKIWQTVKKKEIDRVP